VALTKSGKVSLYAITSVTSNTVSVGSAVDVSTYYGATVRVRMGRGTGSAFTTAPIARIEGSYVASSPTADDWIELCSFQAALGASIGSQAVSGTSNAADTTLLLAANTNFASGDYIFIQNGTLANSEWKHCVGLSTNTFTLQEALINAQTSSNVRNQAEIYVASLDLTGINNLRMVVNAYGSGQAAIYQAIMGAVSGL
jgi:hypothetical protein